MKVLHVVASQQRRGGEIFAAALISTLTLEGLVQRVAVIHSEAGLDVRFEAPVTRLARQERSFPGIRLNAGALVRLRSLVTAFQPDVIQAHGGEALKYVAASNAGLRTRTIYRRIGDSRQFDGARWRERGFATIVRRTARVIAVARSLRQEMLSRYRLDPARVTTIPNGVDGRALRPSRTATQVKAELGIEPSTPVVLSVGALTWEKDPLLQAEVVRRCARFRSIGHVFVGHGPLRSRVEHAIRQGPPTYQGRVLGIREDIGDLLAASDIVLLGSRTEGMPASVIEAGMAAVPVVGFSLPGVQEVVIDGSTGRLVPPGDDLGLSEVLLEVLASPDARAAMGRRAQARCTAMFDIRVIAPRYQSVFEEVARR
jgi:glycosyltransferase involved in cell wall biosynthesis